MYIFQFFLVLTAILTSSGAIFVFRLWLPDKKWADRVAGTLAAALSGYISGLVGGFEIQINAKLITGLLVGIMLWQWKSASRNNQKFLKYSFESWSTSFFSGWMGSWIASTIVSRILPTYVGIYALPLSFLAGLMGGSMNWIERFHAVKRDEENTHNVSYESIFSFHATLSWIIITMTTAIIFGYVFSNLIDYSFYFPWLSSFWLARARGLTSLISISTVGALSSLTPLFIGKELKNFRSSTHSFFHLLVDDILVGAVSGLFFALIFILAEKTNTISTIIFGAVGGMAIASANNVSSKLLNLTSISRVIWKIWSEIIYSGISAFFSLLLIFTSLILWFHDPAIFIMVGVTIGVFTYFFVIFAEKTYTNFKSTRLRLHSGHRSKPLRKHIPLFAFATFQIFIILPFYSNMIKFPIFFVVDITFLLEVEILILSLLRDYYRKKFPNILAFPMLILITLCISNGLFNFYLTVYSRILYYLFLTQAWVSCLSLLTVIAVMNLHYWLSRS